jgi:hypothetical protein
MTKLYKTANEYDAIALADVTFVAVPDNRRGDLQIFQGRGLELDARFTNTWKRVADLGEFVAYVGDQKIHKEQLAMFGRTSGDAGARTPWGKADHVTVYGTGVLLYSTPGHGGFKVYKKQNASIPEPYRNEDGWYEEDCAYAKVVAGMPDIFTDLERRDADKTLKNWFPDEYEAVNGVVVSEDESVVRKKQIFSVKHAEDYVVIAASQTDDYPGMALCIATVGGKRGGFANGVEIPCPEERKFIIPLEEYRTRSENGFVVDLDKHREIVPETPSFAM